MSSSTSTPKPRAHPIESTPAYQALLTTPILTLPRNIIVRPLQPDDAAAIATLANDRKIWFTMGNDFPSPYTREYAKKTIKKARKYKNMASKTKGVEKDPYVSDSNDSDSDDDEEALAKKKEEKKRIEEEERAEEVDVNDLTPTAFAITMHGKLVGWIDFDIGTAVNRHAMWLAYWIGAPYRGQGIMTDVLRAFTEWCWKTFEEERLVNIFAGVFVSWNKESGNVLRKCGFRMLSRERGSIRKAERLGDYEYWALEREGLEKRLYHENGEGADLSARVEGLQMKEVVEN